ncbi:hypothetical protein CTAYLR_001841 [Chrysophaeum taylorii]|uniref:Methyltransferase type 11 domain-containing protein n=1 Tax=Chrysophaeum taylorii TaxID=2483200 RepID=A0AAD7U8C6_9STRA|nr:hypothetical protein CTAYLR_001841 [Chrysophaeum taylorii]
MPEVPASLQEPGLKVPATAWKWPRTWPFGSDGFVRSDESLVDTSPGPIFDKKAAETLRSHLVRHLASSADRVLYVDGSGSGESYLPTSSGGEELWLPPREVVRSSIADWTSFDETLPYETESFDAIVLANAAELSLRPRALFRDLWRTLKPGGRAIVAFSSARCSTPFHAAQTTKMWRDYNDAQRLYIVGSFFHFSAGAPAAVAAAGGEIREEVWGSGWRGLRGYDYLGTAEQQQKGLLGSFETSSDVPVFVVQADKARPAVPGDGAIAVMDTKLWATPNLEEDDKRLCATRILSLLSELGVADPAEKERLAADAASVIPVLYEVLAPMATVIATPLLAQLAANLALVWNADSPSQINALREGLGLDPPGSQFWKPLGDLTASLSVDDKLWLLCDLLPLFDDAVYPVRPAGAPVALSTLLDGDDPALSGTLAHLSSTLNDASDRDRQLLAVDLVARDFLPAAADAGPDESSLALATSDYLAWVRSLQKPQLQAFLDDRKAFREVAQDNAKLAELDPEAAAKAAEDQRRAAAVEEMLNDIARRADAPTSQPNPLAAAAFVKVLEKTPTGERGQADCLGVQLEDAVIAANGEALLKLTFREAISKIKAKGFPLKLCFLRSSTKREEKQTTRASPPQNGRPVTSRAAPLLQLLPNLLRELRRPPRPPRERRLLPYQLLPNLLRELQHRYQPKLRHALLLLYQPLRVLLLLYLPTPKLRRPLPRRRSHRLRTAPLFPSCLP